MKNKLSQCRNIKTAWSKDAKERIIDFYVDLRNKGNTKSIKRIRISPKKLETLKKISEGYARLSERQDVSIEDVEKTIKLFEHSLDQVGNDS
jgi:DNA replicative helicase MCM subunit Mcm2 (Cdc46/Mcm family)